MTDQRLDLLKNWLQNLFASENLALSSVNDDASFRRYFRLTHSDGNSFIAVDAPPEKENSRTFIKIAKLLQSNNLYAPKIIESDLEQGFLLLEDLGNTTFLQSVDGKRMKLYQQAIDELIKIQAIDCQKAKLSAYDEELLQTEMQLFSNWYLPKNHTYHSQLSPIFEALVANALGCSQVFVHRDYHGRNLMMVAGKIAIIDFQDALIGANTYDLCSLLKDAYLQLEDFEVQKLLHYYYEKAGIKSDFSKFEKQFELMGLQRHLKILGIFTRLSVRDGKHQYLKDIPLVEQYVLKIVGKYPEFSLLKELICKQ
ncbi:MAG: phosphotransferase [Candidatus Thioglobus sp.]|nr:MAG: phosphotransferase [Candidatus Thioglobus sp.]